MKDVNTNKYERKVTPLERFFRYSPYSVVTMIARIKGHVSEKALNDAIKKARKRHSLLRVRLKEDHNHSLLFTSEGAGDIPVEVIPRMSKDHWISVHQESCKIPFEFDKRPPIRFILVHSAM